jgi:predicted RNase H-like HicB family nuclease
MPDFIAVVFRTPLDAFVAEFPGLTGCIAFSRTLEEIPGAAADALCAFLEAMEQSRQAIPNPPTFDAIASDPEYEGRIASITVGRPNRCNWTAAGIFPAANPIAANDH